jgi:hypothetical protein
MIKRKVKREKLFYILVRVGQERSGDRFFVVSQQKMTELLDHAQQIREARNSTDKTDGFSFTFVGGHEACWKILPGADSGAP